MATIYPQHFNPATMRNNAERDAFYWFRNLPDAWRMFPNYRIRNRANGSFQSYETDLLLYHERFGFVVVEVKGWIAFCRTNGSWENDGKPVDDPLNQAEKEMYSLRDRIQKGMVNGSKFPICWFVCFPNVQSWQQLQIEGHGVEFSRILTREELEDATALELRLMGELGSFQGRMPSVDAVMNALVPNLVSKVPVSEMVDRIEALFPAQQQFLDAVQRIPRFVVEGCAGSGKTLLAMHKASFEARANPKQRVLLCCFNDRLAEYIADNMPDNLSNIIVKPFLRYCAEKLGVDQTEIQNLPQEQQKTFWERDLPTRWADFHEREGNEPDSFASIIIDEGQDFSVGMWRMVRTLLRQEVRLCVFYDPRQNLYRNPLGETFLCENYPCITLDRSVRNTQMVCQRVSQVGKGYAMNSIEGAPAGVPDDVQEMNAFDPNEVSGMLKHCLDDLRTEGFDLQKEVVVLGARKMENLGALCNSLKPYRLTEDSLPTGNAVRYSTTYKFKGFDSPAVVLLVDERLKHWSYPGNLYTAMSRACIRLSMIRYGHSNSDLADGSSQNHVQPNAC